MNLTQQEQNYYELIVDMLDDGIIDDSERSLLNKKKDRYGLSDARSKEIEDFALHEIQNKNKPKFNTEGEEEYYELLEDMLDDSTIDESGRNLLNKRKSKYGISDERAEEFENYIKSVKGINNIVSDSANSSSKENADNLFEQGKSHYNDKNYEESIRCLNKAVELAPNDWINWHWLGTSYNQNGDYEEAIRCLNKAVELNPDDANSWSWLCECYNRNWEYVKSIEAGEKGLLLNPNNQSTWHWLGTSYNQNGDYEEAIRCLNKAVELNTNDANSWTWLCECYNNNG
ncbi:tetratricopeptide repeat protein, partial [Brachyspira pulli]|uniref:tetratricopeptide repeat protein n=1 Tax=Brachyspira pulli TaxID=310721 RepID=UPI003007A981